MNDLVSLEPTPEQLTVIKETICKDATPEEMNLYLFDCQRQGVHPLDRLIHFTKRKTKNADGTWGSRYTPITSIDFFRMRAEASGEYGGQDDAVFTNEEGQGLKASVTVYRFLNGQRVPITASARMKEYQPESQYSLWTKMPFLMLAKCAEALALRKAFPKQLHGLYTHDEMAQAEKKSMPGTQVLQGASVKDHLKAQVSMSSIPDETDFAIANLEDGQLLMTPEGEVLDAIPPPPPEAAKPKKEPAKKEPPKPAIPRPAPAPPEYDPAKIPPPGAPRAATPDVDTTDMEIGICISALQSVGMGQLVLKTMFKNYGLKGPEDRPKTPEDTAEYLRELREQVDYMKAK